MPMSSGTPKPRPTPKPIFSLLLIPGAGELDGVVLPMPPVETEVAEDVTPLVLSLPGKTVLEGFGMNSESATFKKISVSR